MPSIISRMLNETPTQQPAPTQQPLNDSIAAVRQMMQAMSNPQQVFNAVVNNPQVHTMMQQGMSLENIARSMAAAKGIDINQLLQALQK